MVKKKRKEKKISNIIYWLKFVQIIGTISSPSSPSVWSGRDISKWLTFKGVTGLLITGTGTIDSHGSGWWGQSCRDHPNLVRNMYIWIQEKVRCHNKMYYQPQFAMWRVVVQIVSFVMILELLMDTNPIQWLVLINFKVQS